MPPGSLVVRDLGLVPYESAALLQDELAEARRHGAAPDTLLLLEHPPVVTLGRRGTPHDVYLSEADLARRGISLVRSTRGGLVTYHGPGQLVGYPIVHLQPLGLTVPRYVHSLESALIAALQQIDVTAFRREDHVGVWTDQGKIAAIGIARRHGVTLHGFAVNLQPDISHFDLINPCGIGTLGVTSAERLLGHPVDIAPFKRLVAEYVASELGLHLSYRISPFPSWPRRKGGWGDGKFEPPSAVSVQFH